MEDQQKWFTNQERKLLWETLENYLEDEEWSETLEEEGVTFDPAVVKSTWVKLDRFDKQGPIGLEFTGQEQALLWALIGPLTMGGAGCTRDGEPGHQCNADCLAYEDLVGGIIRKLPAPALKHNLVVEVENEVATLDRLVFPNPGETTEEYIARAEALHAQRLREEADTLASLERMLKDTR